MVILLFVLLAIGFFIIYTLIEFFEYLKKFHGIKWKELSFERPFGFSQEDLFFYPIRPLKFIPFIFAKNDINDKKVIAYKNILKLSLLAIALFVLICRFI
jgi:hypothetical protein